MGMIRRELVQARCRTWTKAYCSKEEIHADCTETRWHGLVVGVWKELFYSKSLPTLGHKWTILVMKEWLPRKRNGRPHLIFCLIAAWREVAFTGEGLHWEHFRCPLVVIGSPADKAFRKLHGIMCSAVYTDASRTCGVVCVRNASRVFVFTKSCTSMQDMAELCRKTAEILTIDETKEQSCNAMEAGVVMSRIKHKAAGKRCISKTKPGKRWWLITIRLGWCMPICMLTGTWIVGTRRWSCLYQEVSSQKLL